MFLWNCWLTELMESFMRAHNNVSLGCRVTSKVPLKLLSSVFLFLNFLTPSPTFIVLIISWFVPSTQSWLQCGCNKLKLKVRWSAWHKSVYAFICQHQTDHVCFPLYFHLRCPCDIAGSACSHPNYWFSQGTVIFYLKTAMCSLAYSFLVPFF